MSLQKNSVILRSDADLISYSIMELASNELLIDILAHVRDSYIVPGDHWDRGNLYFSCKSLGSSLTFASTSELFHSPVRYF